jgi:UDP-glucuronate 4-epimerase
VQTVLITGCAGFIGSHLAERLLARGDRVIGVDNFDEFYDPRIKRRNIEAAGRNPQFHLIEQDMVNRQRLQSAVRKLGHPVDCIVHLAARAGVRPSLEQPALYSRVNVEGTVSLLELARELDVPRFVFGSSSSVYGGNQKIPFSEGDPVESPISPYAATKRAGELICHTYHHLYGFAVYCLRFFTVYGPRQRPDLAIHKFTKAILAGRPIPVFGDGQTQRDYTYIEDILAGVEVAIDRAVGFEIINLGESRPVVLSDLISIIEAACGRKAIIQREPMQPGDMHVTYADVRRAAHLLGYKPRWKIEEGIREFVAWFRHEKGAEFN